MGEISRHVLIVDSQWWDRGGSSFISAPGRTGISDSSLPVVRASPAVAGEPRVLVPIHLTRLSKHLHCDAVSQNIESIRNRWKVTCIEPSYFQMSSRTFLTFNL